MNAKAAFKSVLAMILRVSSNAINLLHIKSARRKMIAPTSVQHPTSPNLPLLFSLSSASPGIKVDWEATVVKEESGAPSNSSLLVSTLSRAVTSAVTSGEFSKALTELVSSFANVSASMSSIGHSVTVSSSIVAMPSFPRISLPLNVTSERTFIRVTVKIFSPGSVSCISLSPNSYLTSTTVVKQFGTTAYFSQVGFQDIFIYQLSPSTTYTVYCYSEDFSANGMDLATVEATKATAVTECCRQINIQTTFPSILEYSNTSSAIPPSVFQFALDSLPPASTLVRLSAVPQACSWTVVGVQPSIAIVPSSFHFSPSSFTLLGSFIVRGRPSCYNVTIHDEQGFFTNSSFVVAIRSLNTPPDPPILSSAILSSDGSSISIMLNEGTDQGGLILGTRFPCAQILQFELVTDWICFWSSSKQITAIYQGSASSNLFVQTGYRITMKAKVVKAVCSIGQQCSFANASSTVLEAPLYPTTPSVSLSSPSSVSFCSDIALDPSASTGQGAHPWSSVRWSVVGANSSVITSWLNLMFPSTEFPATIPNRMLTTGSFKFTLSLTNFLRQTSAASVMVSVTENATIPQVAIGGPSTVFTFRPNPLSFLASGSLTQCGTVSSNVPGLSYAWSVRRAAGDSSLTSPISLLSTSLNPRSFNVAPFTFNASSKYILAVTVFYGNGGTQSVASTSITVQVGQSGVRAVLSGGNFQTFSSQQPIALDASSSYDVDYPTTSALTFSWMCVEVSPTFGGLCPNAGAFKQTGNIPILYIFPNQLNITTETTLNVTVFVSNKDGATSSSSLSLRIVVDAIPAISISSFASFQVVGQNIILSGLIRGIGPVVATWSSPSMALAAISLTPVAKSFPGGAYVFQLALDSTSLSAGLTYSFQLGATYDLQPGAPMNAVAQVTVTMNSPPTGGTVRVQPTQGFAFNTTFTVRTAAWTTNPSNYPIVYVLYHYSSPHASAVVLKSSSAVAFVQSFLGQGLPFNNYNTSCAAVATDNLGSSSTASAVVIVQPWAEVSTAYLTQFTSAAIQNALTNNDPVAVAAVVGAVSATLNAVNCSVPLKCISINRRECSTTPRTCGSCLSGYIGTSGDSNTPCGQEAQVRRMGDSCTGNLDCLSGLCLAGVCGDVGKPCPNDCSNHGDCQYLDLLGRPASTCSESSSFCTAVCQCAPSWHGTDCSLSFDALASLQASRAALCQGMYSTLAIQDVTVDVVTMRASTVAAILLDIAQISDNALFNCTAALVETIRDHPALAGSSSAASLCAQALSNVLAKGPHLPPLLAADVSSAMSALAVGVQGNMAVGQSFMNFTTSNSRLTTGIVYSSDLSQHQFSAPQTSAETFESAAKTAVMINTSTTRSSNAAIGVSILQYNNNALNATSAISPGVGIQSFSYSLSSNGRRQLSDPTQPSQPMIYTFTIPNLFEIETSTKQKREQKSAQCARSSAAHSIAVTCPGGQRYDIFCPANDQGVQNYTCPVSYSRPQCEEYTGQRFSAKSSCKVVASTPFNITCRCIGTEGSRRLSSFSSTGSSSIRQYSTSATIVTTEFVTTFESAKRLNVAAVEKNKVVLILMSVLLGLFVICCVALIRVDVKEMRQRQDVMEKERLSSLPINEFLDLALPPEFTDTPWFVRLWNKLMVEHPWICVVSPFEAEKDVRFALWTKAMVS